MDESILRLSGSKAINFLLHGDSQFDSNKNTTLLNAAITHTVDLGRFTASLV